MPLRHEQQCGGIDSSDMNSANNVNKLQRAKTDIALRLNGATWQYNLWDETGWKNITGGTYDPPMEVRAINLCDDSEDIRKLHYDAAGYGSLWSGASTQQKMRYQTGIMETFRTNAFYPVHVTRIYLDAYTTATEIHLHG